MSMGKPGVGAREHPRRFRSRRQSPACDALAKAGGAVEHTLRIRHLRHLPLTDILVEPGGAVEHTLRIRHLRHLPLTDVHVETRLALEQKAHVRHTRHVPVGHGQLAQPIADARVNCYLELGPGGDVQGTQGLSKHPASTRRHALQHVAGVALGDAGRAAREGVGAGADVAVEGRKGRIARVVPARPPAIGKGVTATALEPRIPCVCRTKYAV
mmetsp:Transcript_12634/g.53334  ORF Transcript_12634/g.53334 Transcript_12634/m.53334 type:complete len:213 (+) Transcript_12634:264-902(+)